MKNILISTPYILHSSRHKINFYLHFYSSFFYNSKKEHSRALSVPLLTQFSHLLLCPQPILRKKYFSMFILSMVNCFMKSYAFSSVAFSVRFLAFNFSFCRFLSSLQSPSRSYRLISCFWSRFLFSCFSFSISKYCFIFFNCLSALDASFFAT